MENLEKVKVFREVEDENLVKELEARKQRKGGIRQFLLSAETGKWYEIEWNRGAVLREAKRSNIKIQTTELNDKTYVKILSKP
ncbi:MAG: hypothetical protein QXG39_10060 [Candidatus Aenigmatarchaeota archaeon]